MILFGSFHKVTYTTLLLFPEIEVAVVVIKLSSLDDVGAFCVN